MKMIRIAVMGGGLAGLTAAYLLNKIGKTFGGSLNIEVTIFEATNCFGSGMSSRRNFIVTDTEREIFSLAREIKIDLVPQPYLKTCDASVSKLMKILVSEILFLKSKKIIEKSEDWSKKKDAWLDKLDAMSIIEYFSRKDMKAEEIRLLLSSTVLAAYTENFDDLSALDALRFMSQYVRSKFLYKMKEGIGSLSRALVDSLNADKKRIFLNQHINTMKWEDGTWNISFKGSARQQFDFVVMSKPQQYKQQNDSLYFRPGQRRLMVEVNSKEKGLFFAEEFTTAAAPTSMNSAVKSAYRVVMQHVLPKIRSALFGEDDQLMPTVEMAIFTSVNDPQLEIT